MKLARLFELHNGGPSNPAKKILPEKNGKSSRGSDDVLSRVEQLTKHTERLLREIDKGGTSSTGKGDFNAELSNRLLDARENLDSSLDAILSENSRNLGLSADALRPLAQDIEAKILDALQGKLATRNAAMKMADAGDKSDSLDDISIPFEAGATAPTQEAPDELDAMLAEMENDEASADLQLLKGKAKAPAAADLSASELELESLLGDATVSSIEAETVSPAINGANASNTDLDTLDDVLSGIGNSAPAATNSPVKEALASEQENSSFLNDLDSFLDDTKAEGDLENEMLAQADATRREQDALISGTKAELDEAEALLMEVGGETEGKKGNKKPVEDPIGSSTMEQGDLDKLMDELGL